MAAGFLFLSFEKEDDVVKIDFGGTQEEVITVEEFPLDKAKEILAAEQIAVIGYGVQGPAQSLNLRDNGFNVIIGQAKEFEKDWNRAKEDGWVPGETLFDIEEATQRGTIVKMLVSDAAQKIVWPSVKRNLNPGDALYFSHGFSIVYKDQTGVVPPDDIDVILVAPKGSGTSVRRLFQEGRGINSSYAVFQDSTGRALDRAMAIGIAIGSGYMFETTFEKEVLSDLTGERGTLMGGIYGLWLAQYEVLRERGHTPSEAFNETVEEATQSLYPLISEKGMDWMYANCSTTAQRGALDWYKKFRDAVKPVFNELYDRVKSGEETARTLDANSRPDYKEQLEKELAEIRNSEMWRAGAAARSLRPERR